MLSKRTLLLTAPALLTSFLATAQSTSQASSNAGASILFWLLVGILGVVLLLVIVTGASVASATRYTPLRPAPETIHSTPQAEEGTVVC